MLDTANPVFACHPANQAEDTKDGALRRDDEAWVDVSKTLGLVNAQTVFAKAEESRASKTKRRIAGSDTFPEDYYEEVKNRGG